MDVRQLTLPVSEPSAAVVPRERFLGMPKRGLAFLLANVMFWQPVWAQADGIAVSGPATSLDHAGNGVPIVNIAAPNASGLSHNQFKDYNVGANGVILNNATRRTQSTQLGGIVLGNRNLNGTAAKIILNEVNGGSPSQLNGYTEVAGQSARVIVANPYGISCNGCGFINTPRVTLTTGKPVLNGTGGLDHYQVDGGSISIDGVGLNANNVDSFEIITRSAKINADLQAKNLSIITGRNDVNAQTLNATARADDGSAKPELAIDSSALGGMYAGAIKLVGTEAGVGVKLAGNLAASGGDIQISANGQLNLAQTAASGAINVNAASLETQGPVYAGTSLNVQTQGDLTNQKNLAARDSVNLSAGGQLTNNGIIEAGVNADNSRNSSGDVNVSAQSITNSGNSVIASRHLSVSGTTLNNVAGTLRSQQNLTVQLSGGLNNTRGLLSSEAVLSVSAASLANRLGSLSSAGQLSIASGGGIDNQGGQLVTDAGLTLSSTSLDNSQAGSISGKSAVSVSTGAFNNNAGSLSSGSSLTLNAGQVSNQKSGRIASDGALNASVIGLDQQGGQLFSNTGLTLDLNHGQLNNSNGLITAPILVLNNLDGVVNKGGEISSAQSFSLSARTLDNSAGDLISKSQLTLNADTLINQHGLLSGWQGLSVTGGSLDNRNTGTLSSRSGDVNVSLRGDLLNSANGALVSQKALTVKAASLDNRGGILSSGTDQSLTISDGLDNGQNGLIDSGATLTLNAGALTNVGGTINAQQDLTLNATSLDNTKGTLAGNGAVTLNLLGILTNTGGKLASAGPLLIQKTSQINNQGGQIVSQGLMKVLTGGLDNSHTGTVAANGALVLTASGAVQNNADGLIYSKNADVQLQAASLANATGTVQSQDALALTLTGDLDNQGGRVIAQGGDLTLKAGNVDNRGGVLSSLTGAVSARLSGGLSNGQGGMVQGQSLDLTAQGGIDNTAGRLAAQTGDVLIHTTSLNNSTGGLYATGGINVSGSSLDNSSGQIAGDQIDLTLSGALSNRLGIVESGSTLSVAAASVDNQTGKLRALGTSGKTNFQIGGQFDNQNGTVESANTDLALTTGSFLNTNGTLLHVGTGTFDIDSRQAMAAGGSLVTRGALSLSGNGLTNSSVIQAGRLTLKLNNFSQTADGQLLASDSLVGTGSNWSNDGLIASDGSLNLTLGGAYSGSGRLSASGNLSLKSDQVSLSKTASIAGAGTTTLNVSGPLTNYGRLTSSRDLILNANSVANYGTLGSAQALTVTTPTLLNDHGLIFSGGDMSLRVGDFTNSYADVYSLAKLSIDHDGAGGWANSILNSSSSIKSDGAMSLAASTIQNIRALLTVENTGIYTAKAYEIACIEGVNAGDCSGKQNHVWEVVTREKLEVTAASAASSITAGGNLSLTGGDLLNASSQIATSGDLTAVLNNLTNRGVETSDTEHTRQFRSARTRNAGSLYKAASTISDKYWYQSAHYDPNNLGGIDAAIANFIARTESELTKFNTTTQLSKGDQTYAAVIQAAGAVKISTQNNFDNSTVRAGYTYVGSGPKTNTDTPGSAFSTRVSLNAQLPPDLAQQQVKPTTLPGFSLPTGKNGLFRLSGQDSSDASTGPQSWTLGGASLLTRQHQDVGTRVSRVQGVPSSSGGSHPQKYLIETNPALTDLKQFMSSDYLLSALGYDPDQSARRLGDGLYEQTLIQQAIVARTGQRFLDGETSDEAQFRYLMDNAIASKDALKLSVGVSLTAEQVAALTHDIVWLENEVIDGQTVLVPVLYLANANNRLAPNGALVQGRDVTLIAGKNLDNAGTLKATNGLSAAAGNNLVNSGLINTGRRLDLLAGNDLTNKAGGIIAGRDVNVSSRKGDVINERTVTSHQSSGNGYSQQRDFVDSAGRIEAANDLTISAGRDVNNSGGVLQSGRDLRIGAGRDVKITSAAQVVSNNHGVNINDSSLKHYGAEVTSGKDLSIQAARDLSVVGSQLNATGNAALDAGNDLTLASSADEEHRYSKTKKVTSQEDHVHQNGSNVKVGDNLTLNAGNDLKLISSKVEAGNEAYLSAGNQLALLAAQDSDYSLYDMKKKGRFGSKKTQRDEVTDVKNIGSQIKTGGDLSLVSGSDQRYQGAKLSSGKDLTLDSGGAITFEAVKDLHQESHEKSSSNLAWQSAKGKGKTDETLRQSEFIANGKTVINAVNGLHIDIKQIDQKSVSETIDVMVKADPQLAWLKDAEARGDVNWRKVQEVHDSFKYSHSGLGAGAVIAIMIIAAALTAGAASAAIGTSAGATAGSGTAMAAAGTSAAGEAVAAGWANAALTSVVASAAGTTAVSTINNKGNPVDVFKDVTSSDALKGYAITGVTAGMTAGYFDDWTGTETNPITDKITSPLSTWKGIGQFAANQSLQNGTSMALSKIMGQGGDLGDALKNTLFNTLAAASFNAVGDYAPGADGSVQKIMVHAMVGGLLSQVSGGDFRTGALAAGANEALVADLDKLLQGNPNLLSMSSQLVGMLAAATQSNADAESLEKGAWVAQNATQYNFLNHQDVDDLKKALDQCGPKGNCDAVKDEFDRRDAANSERLNNCGPAGTCAVIREELDDGSHALADLWKQDTTNLSDGYLRTNINEWASSGPRVAGEFASKIVNGDAGGWGEFGQFLDQEGFNPFGVNPGALPKVAESGKVSNIGYEESLDAGSESPRLKPIDGPDGGGGAKGNQLVNGKWVDAEGLPLPVPSSVGASGRVPNVLQTGGNTLNKSTANALNEHFGESLAPREWGRALEALKADAGKLPNNFHGRILDNGDYVGKSGEVIGNIRDYLP
jgi:filamentous hemagglutinin